MTAHADPLTRYAEDDAGCWLWTAHRRANGYGWMRHDGRTMLAHRFFYEQHVGAIPDGHDLHHVCGTRACVNPAHLTPLLHRDHAATRLTAADAREIRRMRGAGALQREIAAHFGVAKSLVSMIVNGKAWADA